MKKLASTFLSAAALLAATTTYPSHAQAPSPAQAQTRPTDAQIVKMLVIGAQLEVEYATIALATSKDEAVRHFAERMVKDHSAVVDGTTALATRLKIGSEDSPISAFLSNSGAANKQKLGSLSGAAFDSFYVANEVRFHKLVIDTTRNLLVPSAVDPELKTAVAGWLPMYERHEQHAEMLQAERAKAGAASAG